MKIAKRLGLVGIMALCVVAGLAGKPPAGSGDSGTLPAVTPNHNFGVFVSRPDLGGVLDTSTNVVWGYSHEGVANRHATYAGAMNANSWYAATFSEIADDNEGWATHHYVQAASLWETDPLLAQRHLVYADRLTATLVPLREAGTVADHYSNWRPPTLDEARDAVAKGLFTRGETGLNQWTFSPVDLVPGNELPFPLGLAYPTHACWTSDTEAKGKYKDHAWVYEPLDGSARRIGKGSAADVIVVRTHTP